MENALNPEQKLTVLVIEDHPDQRDLLAIVLQREGYRVVTRPMVLKRWKSCNRKQFILRFPIS